MYMERKIGQTIGELVRMVDKFFDNCDISIGKLGRKIDWVEKQMERMIGSIGKLGRNVHGAYDRIDLR